ncbi:hypothetical protein SteCoe_38172 [Stentor coeruleus]|uniref:Uncharacterized protein n=1 Tax=Stentor coeruleus TaxID=5963 RepID=A0A1R2ALQ7_9CILI|nr:hypothetical protein SteCoe_38172 [Stentor coeruleus]
MTKTPRPTIFSPKASPQALPSLHNSNISSSSLRHSLPLEATKSPTRIPIKTSLSLLVPLTSPITDPQNKGQTFSEWTKSLINDKDSCQNSLKIKQTENYSNAFKKAENIYEQLSILYQDLDNLPLSDYDLLMLKKSFLPIEQEDKYAKNTNVGIAEEKNGYLIRPISRIIGRIIGLSKYSSTNEMKKLSNEIENSWIKEQSLTENENMEILKNYAHELVIKCEKLEEVYSIDTSKLKKRLDKKIKELSALHADREEHLRKIEVLNEKYEACKKNLDENEKRHLKEIEDYKNQIAVALEDMHKAKLETSQTADYMKKTTVSNKQKDIEINELKTRIAEISESNTKYISEIFDLKVTLKNIENSLDDANGKSYFLEKCLQDLKNLTAENTVLKESLKCTTDTLNFIDSSYQHLQMSYSKFQQKALETEVCLKTTIEKLKKNQTQNTLQPSPQASPQPENHKFRRYQTMSTPFEIQNNDAALKVTQKISLLEEKLHNIQHDYDKQVKDLIYNRKLIDEKNAIIGQLEEKFESFEEECTKKIRKNVLKEIQSFLEDYRDEIKKRANIGECRVCKKSSLRLVIWPCDNQLCKRTACIGDKCSDCEFQVKIFDLKIMKGLLEEFNTTYLTSECYIGENN